MQQMDYGSFAAQGCQVTWPGEKNQNSNLHITQVCVCSLNGPNCCASPCASETRVCTNARVQSWIIKPENNPIRSCDRTSSSYQRLVIRSYKKQRASIKRWRVSYRRHRKNQRGGEGVRRGGGLCGVPKALEGKWLITAERGGVGCNVHTCILPHEHTHTHTGCIVIKRQNGENEKHNES